MSVKNILVTGIGGNVGQGILRNLISYKLPFGLIGTNTTAVSAGNYLCDKVFKVPFALDSSYIDVINNIILTEKVKLIIPSTDFESLILSQNINNIKCKVACSPYTTTAIFTDKYKTFLFFEKHNIPFAESREPSKYKGEFANAIAKPKSGRGSRGLIINPRKWDHLNDEDYMIQELAEGIELTTAFYVTKKGDIHSIITFDRELQNGATVLCKVNKQFDSIISAVIHKIVTALKVTGSCNIQYIMTANSECIPFEINGRISGTNSIRSNFGFKDVLWTIQENLLDEVPNEAVLKQGVASRILMDVIFPDIESYENLNKNKTHFLF